MSRREKLKKLRENIENTTTEVKDIKKVTRKLVSKSDISADEYKDIISIYDDWQAGVAYSKGKVVKYKDELWEVIQDHTSQSDWTPDSVPALFKSVTAPKTNDGVEIIPDFKQPAGGHDAYKKGDKVKFEGKVYESVVDNNAYSPTAYPAGWKVVD
jgi:hypothetical protein